VLIRDGVIAEVGRTVRAPAGAQVVDGAGKTLVPGFIDSHAHLVGSTPGEATTFGVTTELDMFSDLTVLKQLRADGATKPSMPDVRSAGTLVTSPGGHGSQFGLPIPTLASPDQAQAFVDARIAEGSDYIKIVYDDGKTYGMSIPTIDKATLKAAIDAAHQRRKLAVVHIGSQTGARDAIEAGADGLVHLFVDQAPDAGFTSLAKARGTFVVPTLSVNESVTGTASGETLAEDPRLTPYISVATGRNLAQAFPRRPNSIARYAHIAATVRRLDSLGVPILAGSDAPNPGTGHGVSMHRELELLTQAGLTPVEALAAATATPARVFGLTDRGRIARGLRADLVLVNGDPTTDITATRDIVSVWKQGALVDRAGYRALVANGREDDRSSRERTTRAIATGTVSDFDDGTMSASFGSGWAVSSDRMANGRSSATVGISTGGAAGTARSLAVKGTIDGALPYAWAGAMFSPGTQPMAPADLSSRKEIVFWTKGDGKRYRLMVFSQSRGMTPLVQAFDAGLEWKEIAIPFSALGGIDGRDVLAILFAGGPTPGEFSFQIDGVRVR
jgi:imidazolonepropionase-like amidohydrolase